MFDKNFTCCFTGHRKIKDDDLNIVFVRTLEKVRELILQYGFRYFRVGGAFGYDMFVAELLFTMRDTEFPFIQVILDYPFDGFTHRWDDDQKDAYAKLLLAVVTYEDERLSVGICRFVKLNEVIALRTAYSFHSLYCQI